MKTNILARASFICSVLTVLLFAVLAPVSAQAGIVSTEEVVTEQQLSVDREQLIQTLDRAEVRSALEAYGVDADQAQDRVAAMTDSEVLELQAGLDKAIAGGDAGIVTVLLVVLLVVLLI